MCSTKPAALLERAGGACSAVFRMGWGDRINQYVRVLKIMKKPTMEEFKLAAKVTLIGATVIGIIGYAVYVVFTLMHI